MMETSMPMSNDPSFQSSPFVAVGLGWSYDISILPFRHSCLWMDINLHIVILLAVLLFRFKFLVKRVHHLPVVTTITVGTTPRK